MTAVLTRLSPDTDDFTRALSSQPLASPVSPTILIADDDVDARDAIEYPLRVAGYRTLTAATGPAALSIATHHRPHVIILDGRLPRLDGLSISRQLHTRPATAEIPILMISDAPGATDDDLTTSCHQAEVLHRVSSLLRTAGH